MISLVVGCAEDLDTVRESGLQYGPDLLSSAACSMPIKYLSLVQAIALFVGRRCWQAAVVFDGTGNLANL